MFGATCGRELTLEMSINCCTCNLCQHDNCHPYPVCLFLGFRISLVFTMPFELQFLVADVQWVSGHWTVYFMQKLMG